MVRVARLSLAAIAVSAVVSSLLGACSEFSEDPVAPDAAVEAGGALDGQADAAASDGGGSDAAFRCKDLSPPPLLCLDFDDDGALPTVGFETFDTAATIDRSTSISPPASLRVPGNQDERSILRRTFKGSRSSYRLSTWIHLARNGGLVGFTMPFVLTTSDCTVEIQLSNGTAGGGGSLEVRPKVDASSFVDRHPFLTARFREDKWTLLELEITQGASIVDFEVKLDKKIALERQASRCTSIGGEAQIIVGMQFGDDAVAHFDDFVFDGN